MYYLLVASILVTAEECNFVIVNAITDFFIIRLLVIQCQDYKITAKNAFIDSIITQPFRLYVQPS